MQNPIKKRKHIRRDKSKYFPVLDGLEVAEEIDWEIINNCQARKDSDKIVPIETYLDYLLGRKQYNRYHKWKQQLQRFFRKH